MSDKEPWNIGKLFGKPAAKPLPTSVQKCPSGRHAMSAGWAKCPYCEAEQQAGEKTRVNVGAGTLPPPGAEPDPQAFARPGPTRINTVVDPTEMPYPDNGGHRETRILPEAADGGFATPMRDGPPAAAGQRGATRVIGATPNTASPSARPAQPERRLTGLLFTFSWSPQGHLYEVREGRNFAGSGTVAAESNRDCDVRVGEDATLSSTHFLILCQGGQYRISDCHSTNGTYVDGRLIDALGIELADGARIEAGATLLQFMKIKPPVPWPKDPPRA